MKRCGFCGSNRRKRVHHINGRESDITPDNLMCACHACNLKVAAVMRAHGLGAPAEPNPTEGQPGARNLAQWMIAVKSMRGESNQMSPKAAIALIRATSPNRRSHFAEDIWKLRRARGTDMSTSFSFGAAKNPLFSRSEHKNFGRTIRKRARGATRKGLSKLFGIPLSPGLGGTSSRRSHRLKSKSPHGRDLQTGTSPKGPSVRGDVIEALRGQGYSKSQAEKMTPSASSSDNFESLFRRAFAKNPAELIIFGNPSHLFTRKGISRAVRAGNPIPTAIVEGLGIGVGYNMADRALRGKKNPLPAALLQGLEFTAGSTAAEAALKRKRGRGHNAESYMGVQQQALDRAASEAGRHVRAKLFRNGTIRVRVGREGYLFDDIHEALGFLEGLRQTRSGKNRKAKQQRRNPGSLDRARSLFDTFHHRGSSGVYETQRSAKERKTYTVLGPLVAIGINAEKYDQEKRAHGKTGWEDYKVDHWDKFPHLAFLTPSQIASIKRTLEDPARYVANCPQLASSPNGNQVYAITPDGVDVDLRQFDTDTTKDFVDLGEATFVVYIAKKPDTAYEWVHELGEDGGVRPRLVLNRLGKKELFFVGGSYSVKGPGILN